LPADAPAVSQCLRTDSVTATQLVFGVCSTGGGGGDAYLANSQIFTGRNIFQGSGNGVSLYGVLFKNASNSETAFVVQSSNSDDLLKVDTLNGYVAISNADLILNGVTTLDPTVPTNVSAGAGSNTSGGFS